MSQDFRFGPPMNEAGLSPKIFPRCEDPIENFHVTCTTDDTREGTKQDLDWDQMNETSELYVRAGENNVTMHLNVSRGMPIFFNISNNDTFESELKRELETGKNY